MWTFQVFRVSVFVPGICAAPHAGGRGAAFVALVVVVVVVA